jgi:uncharacterized damage-inducible protein DinB
VNDVLASVVRQVVETDAGDPWYGTSRTAMLEGVTARDAAARPIAKGHSIWELVFHMTAWTKEVTRRLGGSKPATPKEGDWPAVRDVSDQAWQNAKTALSQAHADLLAAIRNLPAQEVAGTDVREPALGTGVDRTGLIVGLAQHDAYHIGQIAVVRQALGKLPGQATSS